MANNRIIITCKVCEVNETWRLEGSRVTIAKYYPSTGWQTFAPSDLGSKTDFVTRLDAWFDEHYHEESDLQLGRWYELEYECGEELLSVEALTNIVAGQIPCDCGPSSLKRDPANRADHAYCCAQGAYAKGVVEALQAAWSGNRL